MYLPTSLREIPEDIQGVSLKPVLTNEGNEPSDWRKAAYYHYYEYPAEHAVKRHYGVLYKNYKLIHFYNDIDSWELYDLKNDPNELHNIYGQEGTEKITRTLRKELLRLQKQYDDPIQKLN